MNQLILLFVYYHSVYIVSDNKNLFKPKKKVVICNQTPQYCAISQRTLIDGSVLFIMNCIFCLNCKIITVADEILQW